MKNIKFFTKYFRILKTDKTLFKCGIYLFYLLLLSSILDKRCSNSVFKKHIKTIIIKMRGEVQKKKIRNR